MKYVKNTFVIIFTLSLSCSCISNAQNKAEQKAKVLKAIEETSNFAAFTLLDEQGKSRCDYNITEGKWYEYEPPWHTGQVINALVESYKVTKNKAYLNEAVRAGNWWISLQITDHPKLKGMLNAIHGDGNDNIVFATVSDGTPGLFNLYKTTGDKKYAEVATSAGKWMFENMYVPEHGVFYDVVDPKTGEVMKENSPFWPDKKDQKLYDVSRPNNEGSLFKDMYEFTGNEEYKKVFIDLCESLVEKQDEYGLWMDFTPNHKDVGTFHPRFNLWYAESLIEGFDLTGNRKYLDAAAKTVKTYLKAMRKDGTFFYVNYLDGRYSENSITGSATAFCGILAIKLVKNGYDEFKDSIERSIKWILVNRFSADHPDKNLRGSVIDTRTRSRQGKIWLTQRDVGTSFGLRFLCDYYNYKFN
ncbi:MAG: glycoside hydrolase family 127 protein [Melioribacteraceae bacterium]|nr:glycoside hydrolase family 127 protein [Melioribacteraceae bacterium]